MTRKGVEQVFIPYMATEKSEKETMFVDEFLKVSIDEDCIHCLARSGILIVPMISSYDITDIIGITVNDVGRTVHFYISGSHSSSLLVINKKETGEKK